MEEKKRYSDEELEEFRAIINKKLDIAKSDYEDLAHLQGIGRRQYQPNQGGTRADGTASAEVHTGFAGCIGTY